MQYFVKWEIDIECDGDPVEAAREAFRITQRPGTSANVFAVLDDNGVETTVDLEEEGYRLWNSC